MFPKVEMRVRREIVRGRSASNYRLLLGSYEGAKDCGYFSIDSFLDCGQSG